MAAESMRELPRSGAPEADAAVVAARREEFPIGRVSNTFNRARMRLPGFHQHPGGNIPNSDGTIIARGRNQFSVRCKRDHFHPGLMTFQDGSFPPRFGLPDPDG